MYTFLRDGVHHKSVILLLLLSSSNYLCLVQILSLLSKVNLFIIVCLLSCNDLIVYVKYVLLLHLLLTENFLKVIAFVKLTSRLSPLTWFEYPDKWINQSNCRLLPLIRNKCKYFMRKNIFLLDLVETQLIKLLESDT